METLEILIDHQGKKVPTVAGLILFGKERAKLFPDAWMQAGRFKGTNKSLILDSTEFHNYPINAMIHADYSQLGTPIRIAIFDDRIKIENPGLLRFGLNIPDIKQGISKLRNRIIGRIFHMIGLTERWGSGIQRIISSCQEGSFPQPKFEKIATHFRVTIFTSRNKRISLVDLTNPNIIELLKQHPNGLTTSKIATLIKLSGRATRTRLLKLIELGLVTEIASSPQDPHRLYFFNSD